MSRAPEAGDTHTAERQPRYTCPLCGFRFDQGSAACAGCPLAGGCEAICCPHCCYRFVAGSRILDALRRIFRPARAGK